jgi:hypothetical protein
MQEHRRRIGKMRMRLGRAALITAVFTGCVSTPDEGFLVAPLDKLARFERTGSPSILEALFQADFSVPDHLRPCCAFGHDFDVSVAGLPIPAVQVHNVVDPEMLGRHAYDGGLVSPKHGVREGFVSDEENGLVYTCRGGFVDIAHVRDYADWTVFLSRRIETMLDTGGAIELSEEGARRFLFVAAVDPTTSARIGRRTLSIQLAQWLAFQLSVWHETATWYGWASLPLFPELASAFSPEDLYSNLLGIRLASYVIQSGGDTSEGAFNRATDDALALALRQLGATPPDVTRRALDAVDGLWWSSQERLPSKRVVLRRNFGLGPEMAPWQIPSERITPQLAADRADLCAQLPSSPAVLRYPTDLEGVSFEQIAKLDLFVGDDFPSALPLPDPGSRWLSNRDLPDVVKQARAENLREFGAMADRPGLGAERR